MKRLLVISNRNPNNWNKKQKVGWSSIEYCKFPDVSLYASKVDIIIGEVAEICNVIRNFLDDCNKNGDKGYITLQGENSVCYYVFNVLSKEKINFVFPVIEKKIIEKKLKNGSVKKTTIFNFVRWR